MSFDPFASGQATAIDDSTQSAPALEVVAPAFASRLGEPLRAYATDFEEAGKQYGVDPLRLAAIASHETGHGTSRAFLEKQNAMGVSDENGPVSFADRGGARASIFHMAQRIGQSSIYEAARKDGSIAALARIYAPVGAGNDPTGLNKDWASGVSRLYAQLAGADSPPSADATAVQLDTLRDVKPEDAVMAEQLGKKHGLDLQTSLSMLPELKQQETDGSLASQIHLTLENSEDLKYPQSAKFLADPNNLAKFKDAASVSALQGIEEAIKGASKVFDPFASGQATDLNAPPPDPGADAGRFQTYVSQVAQGALSTGTSVLKASAILGSKIIPTEGAITQRDNPLYLLADYIESLPNEVLPQNKEIAQGFAGQVFQGLGQLAGIIGTGGVTGLAKASPKAFALLTGYSMEASTAYDEAIKGGATEEQAWAAAQATGVIAGPLDSLVPGHMMERMLKGMGGRKTQAVLNLLLEGGTEALTESGQTVVENAVAKKIYDADRPYWDGVVEAGGVGGTVGGIASLIVSAATGRRIKVETGKAQPAEAQAKINPVVLDRLRKATEENIKLKVDEETVINATDSMDQMQQKIQSSPQFKADPEAGAIFINESRMALGQSPSYWVDASKIADSFLLTAKTPEEQQQAQVALTAFVQDVGIDSTKFQDALNTGGQVQMGAGEFIAKHGAQPIYQALKEDIRFQHDGPSAKEVEEKKAGAQAKLAEVKKMIDEEGKPHPQIVAIGEKLILPKDKDGPGFTAEQRDVQLSILNHAVQQSAIERGQTVTEFLAANPLELRVWQEGVEFVAGQTLFQSSNQDAAYLKAVESGDTETAQKMVDEAVKESISTAELKLGHALKPKDREIRERVVREEMRREHAKREAISKGVTEFERDEIVRASGGVGGKPLYSYRSTDGRFLIHSTGSHPTLNNIGPKKTYWQVFDTSTNQQIGQTQRTLNGAMGMAKEFAKDFPPKHSRAHDEAYLKAVESGDTETAQKMVDEAAKKSGYLVGGWHTSKEKHTAFDARAKTNLSSMGFHFGTKEQAEKRAGQYGFVSSDPQLKQYILAINNPLEVSHMASFAPDHLADKMMEDGMLTDEAFGKIRDRFQSEPEVGKKLVEVLKKNGYDGLKYANEREGEGVSYVPFDPSQIKSADPVTRDDSGKVIPLSQRFNEKSDDIRYQGEETPEMRAWKKADFAAQYVWLDQQAVLAGADDYLSWTIAQKTKEESEVFALQWRKDHPWPPEFHKQSGGGGARAAIQFTPDGKSIINLFKSADISSFSHEVFHYRLNQMRKIIESGAASPQLQADFMRITKWAGSQDGTLTEDQEETVAVVWEKYLLEGKAPSLELVDSFGRMRKWLMSLFKSIKGLVKVDPELSAVFDRMLAGEAQIEEAREYYAMNESLIDLITDDPVRRGRFTKEREDEKTRQVNKKVDKKLKAKAEAEEERKKFTEQATAEVDAQHIHMAIKDATEKKISPSLFAATYGETALAEVQKNQKDIFDEKAGTSIDGLAADHGFASPDVLVDELKAAPTREEAIKNAADTLLEAEAERILNEPQSGEATEADEETHSEETYRSMAEETEVLEEEVKGKPGRDSRAEAKALRNAAKDHIASQIVSDAVKHYRYATTESRFGKKVFNYLKQAFDIGRRAGEAAGLLEKRTGDLNNLLVEETGAQDRLGKAEERVELLAKAKERQVEAKDAESKAKEAKSKEAPSVFEFIKSQGGMGVYPFPGAAAHVGFDELLNVFDVPHQINRAKVDKVGKTIKLGVLKKRSGGLVTLYGQSPELMAEQLQQAGYIKEKSIDEMITRMLAEQGGKKQYPLSEGTLEDGKTFEANQVGDNEFDSDGVPVKVVMAKDVPVGKHYVSGVMDRSGVHNQVWKVHKGASGKVIFEGKTTVTMNGDALVGIDNAAEYLGQNPEAALPPKALEWTRQAAKEAREEAAEALREVKVKIADIQRTSKGVEKADTKQATSEQKVSDLKAKALEARKLQLLNHALVIESIKAREEVRKMTARYSPKKIDSMLKNIEYSFLDPLLEILSRYGLSENKPKQPYDLAQLDVLDPVLGSMMPDFVRENRLLGDFRENLTVDQMRDLDAFIKSAVTVGKEQLTSLRDTEFANIKDFVAKSTSAMDTLPTKTVLQGGSKLKNIAKSAQKAFDALIAATFQPRFQFDVADGYSQKTKGVMGPMLTVLRTINKAELDSNEMHEKLLERMKEPSQILAKATDRIQKEHGLAFDPKVIGLPTTAPIFEELRKDGRSLFTAENLICIILNSGNEDGQRVLHNAYGFGQAEIAKVFAQFTAEEIKAVQGIIDTINTLYPKLSETHFRRYNRDIGKVDAAPQNYTSKDGSPVTFQGGYYPLKFDSGVNAQALAMEEEDIMQQHAGILRTAKPADGFTKGRLGGHSLPPRLDLGVLSRHLSDVVRYITHSEVLNDTNRITKDANWRSLFENKLGKDQYASLRNWLQDLAQPNRKIEQNKFEEWIQSKAEKSRRLATYAFLGFRPINALLQRSNLLNAKYEIGGKWLAVGFKEAGINGTTLLGLTNTEKYKWMISVSQEMRHRDSMIDREVSDATKRMKIGEKSMKIIGTPWSMQDMRQAAFALLVMNDRAVNMPIWFGSYQKHLETMADRNKPATQQHHDAIAFADSIIQKVQPGSMKAELNELQRNKSWFRLVMSFMSWGARYGSRLTFEGKAWKDGKIGNKQYINHLVHEVIAEPWARMLFKGMLLASIPAWWEFLTEPFSQIFSWIPIIKDLPRVFQARKGGVQFDADRALPALEGGKRLAKAASTAIGYAQERKEFEDMAWDAGRYLEYRLGIPASNVVVDLKRIYDNLNPEDE